MNCTKAERDAYLREYYGATPAIAIADALGLNKNQVIGRAFRIGLSRRERNSGADKSRAVMRACRYRAGERT
jgi:hypothetical protein